MDKISPGDSIYQIEFKDWYMYTYELQIFCFSPY